jgi:hypothetical protein
MRLIGSDGERDGNGFNGPQASDPPGYAVEPFGTVLAAYRYPWFPHGTLLGVLLLAGGLGSIGRRRPALPPWSFAVFLLVAPVAALDFDHRYVLPAIPVAAALAVRGAEVERGFVLDAGEVAEAGG